MTMPNFRYAKSTFFATADKVLRTTSGVAAALLALSSGEKILKLADDRRKTGSLSGPSYKHFANDWLTDNGNGGTICFPSIPKERINAVLTEGYRQAVKMANEKQIPVSSVWICSADKNTFEVVTVLNEGVNVQLIVVTPKPVDPKPLPPAVLDTIRVTRYFDDDNVLKHLKTLLQGLGSTQSPLVEDRENGDLTNVSAKPGAGTFDVLT